jgi:uncharacterized membrane protein
VRDGMAMTRAPKNRRPTTIDQADWTGHPAIRSEEQLTRGERSADMLRNGMGSWGFVFSAIVFLAGWMIGNRNVGFDKYPFILLNLILSCLAAMQGAILLIAAKREDQISSDLARHDYETNLEADRIVKQIHALTQEIHMHTVKTAGDAHAADESSSDSSNADA